MSVLDTLGIVQLWKHKAKAEQSIQEEAYRTVFRYRRVFNTPEGQKTLAEILFRLGVGRNLQNDEDRTRYNEAIFLLSRLGIVLAGEEFVQALFTLPYGDGILNEKEHEEEVG